MRLIDALPQRTGQTRKGTTFVVMYSCHILYGGEFKTYKGFCLEKIASSLGNIKGITTYEVNLVARWGEVQIYLCQQQLWTVFEQQLPG